MIYIYTYNDVSFPTKVVNLYQIDDLFLLLCCFCNTLGTLLMSASAPQMWDLVNASCGGW